MSDERHSHWFLSQVTSDMTVGFRVKLQEPNNKQHGCRFMAAGSRIKQQATWLLVPMSSVAVGSFLQWEPNDEQHGCRFPCRTMCNMAVNCWFPCRAWPLILLAAAVSSLLLIAFGHFNPTTIVSHSVSITIILVNRHFSPYQNTAWKGANEKAPI
jgi:hypothetical protein